MRHTRSIIGLALGGLTLVCSIAGGDEGKADAELQRESVVVSVGKREVLRYQLERPADSKLPVESACYFHPVRTPAGTVVTDVAPADHPHHRGIFLAWFDMKGTKDADFWGWGAHAPVKGRRIVNRGVKEKPGGFLARNEWVADDQVLLVEELEATVKTRGPANVIDLTYTLSPDDDLKLPRRAFSGFCVRVPVGAKVEAFGPDGRVDLPNPHHEQPHTDWPASRWYAYELTLNDGTRAAVAVIDHPGNPPSLWHNQRDVRMLNPCIVAPGPVSIDGGKSLVLRYRVVAADGAGQGELIGKFAAEWNE